MLSVSPSKALVSHNLKITFADIKFSYQSVFRLVLPPYVFYSRQAQESFTDINVGCVLFNTTAHKLAILTSYIKAAIHTFEK